MREWLPSAGHQSGPPLALKARGGEPRHAGFVDVPPGSYFVGFPGGDTETVVVRAGEVTRAG